MADLVTHLASALLPGLALRPERAVLLSLGAAFPDVAGRLPGLVAELAEPLVHVPDLALAPFAVLHQPVGAIVAVACLAQAFSDRRVAFLGLAAGVALHFALDVVQDHFGVGYYLLAPFEFSRYELGWIGSEATVGVAPWLGVATAAAWTLRIMRWAWPRRPG